MIGLARDFLEIVALLLLIGQQGSWAEANSKYDRINLFNEFGPGEQQQPQQVQYESNNIIPGNQDHLKRFLLKDLDLDGYMLKQSPKEQWRWFQLKELLETLSSTIPTPPPPPPAPLSPPPQQQALLPIYRSGRNHPTASVNDDYLESGRSAPSYIKLAALSFNQLPIDKNTNKATKPSPLFGIEWREGQPTGGSTLIGTIPRYRSSGGPSIKDTRSQHRGGGSGEEVAIIPMHSRSSNHDYEWKRVENLSKWNNLRGMWGKRADTSGLQLPEPVETPATSTASYAQENGQMIAEDQQVM